MGFRLAPHSLGTEGFLAIFGPHQNCQGVVCYYANDGGVVFAMLMNLGVRFESVSPRCWNQLVWASVLSIFLPLVPGGTACIQRVKCKQASC